MVVAIRFAALALVALLAGCGPAEVQEDSDVQFARDAALVRDPVAGMKDLGKRLHASMTLEAGALILEGPLVPGSSSVSVNSPWTIACGTGLTVYFERAEIDLISPQVQIGDAQCSVLIRRLGAQVQAILAGHA